MAFGSIDMVGVRESELDYKPGLAGYTPQMQHRIDAARRTAHETLRFNLEMTKQIYPLGFTVRFFDRKNVYRTGVVQAYDTDKTHAVLYVLVQEPDMPDKYFLVLPQYVLDGRGLKLNKLAKKKR